jgi:hypothetical protein
VKKINIIHVNGFNTGLGYIEGEEDLHTLYDFNKISMDNDYTNNILYTLGNRLDIRFAKKEIGHKYKLIRELCDNWAVADIKQRRTDKVKVVMFRKYTTGKYNKFVVTNLKDSKITLPLFLSYISGHDFNSSSEGLLSISNEEFLPNSSDSVSFWLRMTYNARHIELKLKIETYDLVTEEDIEYTTVLHEKDIMEIVYATNQETALINRLNQMLPKGTTIDSHIPNYMLGEK